MPLWRCRKAASKTALRIIGTEIFTVRLWATSIKFSSRSQVRYSLPRGLWHARGRRGCVVRRDVVLSNRDFDTLNDSSLLSLVVCLIKHMLDSCLSMLIGLRNQYHHVITSPRSYTSSADCLLDTTLRPSSRTTLAYRPSSAVCSPPAMAQSTFSPLSSPSP